MCRRKIRLGSKCLAELGDRLVGFNISFGHGIHAGIHFRSSRLQSLLLGEAVGLSILQDRAKSYNEPFTIHITKFDGTTATISNH